MKFTVEVFKKDSELLELEINLPEGCDAQLSDIMKWSGPQRGDEGYNLNRDQASAIEALVGREFFDELHIFQLTCHVA